MRRETGPGRRARDGVAPGLRRPALWRWLAWYAGGLLGVAWAAPGGQAEPVTIHWRTERAPVAVEVEGVASEALKAWAGAGPTEAKWARVFAVFAEPADEAARGTARAALPAMAGTWRVEAGRLRFEPRFPLTHGVRYRAEYRPAGGAPVVAYFELPPDRTAPSTTVVAIYPSGDELPENQLKFYVQFSAPMSRGGTYEHVHVRDAAGTVIELPFLELDEELWDPAMTRLTLLIDPGRIKRGVKPLEDIGPVFERGRTYSLTVEAASRDAGGRPLRAKFEKHFRIGEADRTPPDPKRWRVTPPRAGTRDALSVAFDEPLDQALALRLIGVVQGTEGKIKVAGEASLADHERTWRFVPDQPWRSGPHQLRVATTIEDLAGNNIGKTFDVDLASGAPRQLASERVSVAFEVK